MSMLYLQGGGIDDVFSTTHTYMKKRDAKCVPPPLLPLIAVSLLSELAERLMRKVQSSAVL